MIEDNTADVFVPASTQDWLPMFDGIQFKPLRFSDETGAWTVIFRCEKDSFFPAHYHLGPAEFYMVTGHMVYRAGEAMAGDYGYEPVGAFHERTNFKEQTDLYFTAFGPIGFIDDDDRIETVMDHKYVRDLAEKAQ